MFSATTAHKDREMTSATVHLAVVGAHLQGQPLHHQLADRDARLVASNTTMPHYRLYALDTAPPKPGLVRTAIGEAGSGPIEVEVYELGVAEFGSFVAEVPAPLGIGRVLFRDGTEEPEFICEPIATQGAPDITHFGGWRAYLSAMSQPD